MSGLDRMTARALVDAGYMPLSTYVRMFGTDAGSEAPLAPDTPQGADFFTGDFEFVGAYECPARGRRH